MLIDVQHIIFVYRLHWHIFTECLQVVMLYVYGRNCCQTNKSWLDILRDIGIYIHTERTICFDIRYID